MRLVRFVACSMVLAIASVAMGQATQPSGDSSSTAPAAASPSDASTTAPTSSQPPSADQLLRQMLQTAGTAQNSAAQQPQPADQSSAAQGSQATSALTPLNSAPSPSVVGGAADTTPLVQEGTDIVDRIGHMRKTEDGQNDEFDFDSDGHALKDAPMILLPNGELMMMERAAGAANHDLRFRVTGTVTEYHGHNYLLLEKFIVVQDLEQQF